MKATYTQEELAKLSDGERKFIESIESDSKRKAVACSLIHHRLPDKLKVGDDLPNLTLQQLKGTDADSTHTHALRSCVGGRPLLLAFGSYT